jgi:hypothetical protein
LLFDFSLLFVLQIGKKIKRENRKIKQEENFYTSICLFTLGSSLFCFFKTVLHPSLLFVLQIGKKIKRGNRKIKQEENFYTSICPFT